MIQIPQNRYGEATGNVHRALRRQQCRVVEHRAIVNMDIHPVGLLLLTFFFDTNSEYFGPQEGLTGVKARSVLTAVKAARSKN